MKKTSLRLLTVSLSSLVISPASAVILASETFDSGIVGDVLAGGGSGWASNWENFNNNGSYQTGSQFSSAPETFAASGGLHGQINPVTRSNRAFDTSASGPFAAAGLLDGSGNIGADGTTVYIGFSLRAFTGTAMNPETPEFFWGAELHRDGTSDSERVFQAGRESMGSNLNLRATNPDTPLQIVSVGSSEVQYWVLKFEFDSAGDDSASFFLNPALGSPEGTPDAIVDTPSLAFDRIGFGTFIGSTTVQFDDIRVGTEFADVVGVPEPSSSTLLLLGLSGLISRRRRA